jgi:hypothetical protein
MSSYHPPLAPTSLFPVCGFTFSGHFYQWSLMLCSLVCLPFSLSTSPSSLHTVACAGAWSFPCCVMFSLVMWMEHAMHLCSPIDVWLLRLWTVVSGDAMCFRGRSTACVGGFLSLGHTKECGVGWPGCLECCCEHLWVQGP